MRNDNRRGFLGALAFGLGALKLSAAETGNKKPQVPKKVKVATFDAAGNRTGVEEVDMVIKTDAEWRKQLDPEAYDVLRHEGTERAGTGKYAYNHNDGLYHCLGCDTVLFRFEEE